MQHIFIWLIAVSFLLFQFFLQLSTGIVIESIMLEQGLTGFAAGLLSSSFYYVYTTLQIPVGLLFDRYNTRNLLAFNAGICALGCFIFAWIHSLTALYLGRVIIGAGSAFAFVGLSHLLRKYFPLRMYAFMIGLSETLGFTLTVLGMILMGSVIGYSGWRNFIVAAGIVGTGIALLLWFIIPATKVSRSGNDKSELLLNLAIILKNKLAWINGIFVGLEFSVITVFGALWAEPFLQLKLHCTLKTASILTAMLFLGTGVSCPMFGQLSIICKKRKPLMHASCLATAAFFLAVLYLPITNVVLMGVLLFAIGLCCGAYMLTYSIANELAPQRALSTCTGFTNTLAMISAPILQPVVGLLLDKVAVHPGVYSLWNFQVSLLLIPALLLVGSMLVCFLPEKAA